VYQSKIYPAVHHDIINYWSIPLCRLVAVLCMETYHRELGRHVYVTPTSYLELIYTYNQLLNAQQSAVEQMKLRYEVGTTVRDEKCDYVTGLWNSMITRFLLCCAQLKESVP